MEPESMEVIEVKSYKEIPKNFTGIAKYLNDAQYWYFNGLRHREDGPAIIWPDGTQYWYLKGELHREDGPAIIYPSGGQQWYQNGLKHREDGPAFIHFNGIKEWYLNGKLHREDGPAGIYPNGKQKWYLYGIRMTPMEVFEKLSDEKKEKVLWNLNLWK